MRTILFLDSWRHHFAVVLALFFGGLFTSTSFAGTCANRTITNHSLPARSYTVDATPIEEVIATHTASVVWTGCSIKSSSKEFLGTWLAYFPINFGVINVGLPESDTDFGSYGFVYVKKPNTHPHFSDSARIRYLYYINCQTQNYVKDSCLDPMGNPVTPSDRAQYTDMGLRMYVDVTWSAVNNETNAGCMEIVVGKAGTWTPIDGANARAMVLYMLGCTNVRLDFKLSIVKTKPFVAPNSEVSTIHVTGTNNFKYSVCEANSNCSPTKEPGKVFGGFFDVFNSGKPLTINLTKTVRPTGNCIVKLKSAPKRSHL
jgi:hypothetical protein